MRRGRNEKQIEQMTEMIGRVVTARLRRLNEATRQKLLNLNNNNINYLLKIVIYSFPSLTTTNERKDKTIQRWTSGQTTTIQ